MTVKITLAALALLTMLLVVPASYGFKIVDTGAHVWNRTVNVCVASGGDPNCHLVTVQKDPK